MKINRLHYQKKALNYLLLLVLFCTCLPNQAFSNAVPVEKNVAVKKNKPQQKSKAKKFKRNKNKKISSTLFQLKTAPEKQQGGAGSWLIWLLVVWYVISITLLIIGLVIAFPPLWIAAIVLLGLPIAAAIIFAIVFLIMLATTDNLE